MEQQTLIIEDQELLGRIDRLRGDFSRQFLIELSIGAIQDKAPQRLDQRLADPSPAPVPVPVPVPHGGHTFSMGALASPGRFISNVTLLWVMAALLFGFGDTLTSVLVFSQGGYESNPVLAVLLSLLGRSIWAFVMVKIVVFFVLLLTAYGAKTARSWVTPLIVSVTGGFLVLSNVMVLLRLP